MRVSRRKFIKNSAYATSALMAGTALSSCGIFDTPQPPTTTETAEPTAAPTVTGDKNTLYIYGWATYVSNTEVMEGFTKETGIKVVGDSYDSNEVMLAKLQAAGGKSGYSIIYPSDYMVAQMHELDLLLPLNKKLLPNLQNIGEEYFVSATLYDPGNKYGIPVSLGTTGIAYNVKAMGEIVGAEPTDWSFLWEQRNKLRITLLNDVREVMGMALHSLNFSYNAKEESAIRLAFEKLRELMPATANFNTDAWRDPLTAGDLTLSMAFSGDGISLMRQNKQDREKDATIPEIKYILPASGTSVFMDMLAIPKGAPNLAAAHAWMNYIMRPEIAAKISNANSFGTTNKLAKSLVDEDLKAISVWEPTKAYINRSGRISKLDPEVSRIYETYWTRLTSGLG
ncbi:spermidine/putrescine ABC transporter substrate-binding protein [Tumidithrix helvetica PCC 7403]|uniref:ABC transporter substrate-binding protein n=1 Tax=Tumidithrix helvetica TaxID=3457545 RepID=UPI003C9212EF